MAKKPQPPDRVDYMNETDRLLQGAARDVGPLPLGEPAGLPPLDGPGQPAIAVELRVVIVTVEIPILIGKPGYAQLHLDTSLRNYSAPGKWLRDGLVESQKVLKEGTPVKSLSDALKFMLGKIEEAVEEDYPELLNPKREA